MKKYRNLLIIFLCIFFSSCEAEWIMDLDINEDESGKYSISILLDQEAQIFAIETGQTEIGGLESIVDSLPEGFGSTVYQKDKMFGIMIRNSFNSFDEFEQQLDILLSDENTTLLLLPIKEIKLEKIEEEFKVYGEFSAVLNTENITPEAAENLYSGKLIVKAPGRITKPKLDEVNNNTIIFNHSGLLEQSFEVESTTSNINISRILIFSFLGACSSPTAMLGPAYTLSSSGNVLQAGLNYGSNQMITKYTGKTPIENLKEIKTLSKKQTKNIKKETLESEEFYILVKNKIDKTSGILKIPIQ